MVLKMRIKANRIKPKAFKDKKYLHYMHASDKQCYICGCYEIELHHIKTKIQTMRLDNIVIPLCPEHHRGNYSPHGFNSSDFYANNPKETLLRGAEEFYNEYISMK